MQSKQDLLVQAEPISNEDQVFQCLLPCFDRGNKEKQFLITNEPLHALLTDYFVQMVGARRGLQPPGTEYSSLLLIIKNLVISHFVGRISLRQGSPPYGEIKAQNVVQFQSCNRKCDKKTTTTTNNKKMIPELSQMYRRSESGPKISDAEEFRDSVLVKCNCIMESPCISERGEVTQ